MKPYLVIAESVAGLIGLLWLMKFAFDRMEKRPPRSSGKSDRKP